MRNAGRAWKTSIVHGSDHRWLTRQTGLLAFVPVLLGALVCLTLVEASDRTMALVQAVTGVAALCGTTATWLMRRRATPTADSEATLDRMADALAITVAGQWRRAATERRLRYPSPAAVRWRWSQHPVTGPVEESIVDSRIRRFQPLAGALPVEPARLRCGSISDLFEVYDWFTRRLTSDYPALFGGASGRSAARRMVLDGRISMFLDGLDEIPPSLRAPAVRALDTQADLRAVLVSRTAELTAAVVAGHFSGAAAIELQPLTAASAAAYLSRCRPHPLDPAWQELVDRLRAEDPTVTPALTSPLALSLVRDAFPDPGEVDAVFNGQRNETPEAIEAALLDRIATVAYQPRPDRRGPGYPPELARHWLRQIAVRMTRDGTRDLAWWNITTWASAMPRVAVLAVLLVIPNVVFGVVVFGTVFGTVGAVVLGLGTQGLVTAGLAVVCSRGGRQPYAFASARMTRMLASPHGLAGLVVAASVGLAAARVPGLAWGTPGSALIGSTFGLCYGGIWLYSVTIVLTDPQACWRRECGHGLRFGFALGTCCTLTTTMALEPDHGPLVALCVGLAVGCVDWLAIGLLCPQTSPARMAFLQLRLAGVTPIRLMRFLEDANARGILRTVGPVYQFRHARLQDLLAAEAQRLQGDGRLPEPVATAARLEPTKNGG